MPLSLTQNLSARGDIYPDTGGYELQEDDPDSQDFSFSVFQNADDFEVLKELGTPEETVRMEIRHCQGTCVLYRLVYVTEVLFIPAHLAEKVSQ